MSIVGITYTHPTSMLSITWSPPLNRYVVDFPFNKKMWSRMKGIEGVEWSDKVHHKFTLPKDTLPNVLEVFGPQVKWKEKKDIHQVVKLLKEPEETLQNVLSRIPPVIDTSYMKIEPYNFQKLAVAWAATPKGLKSKVRGGVLADLMGLGKTIEALATAGYFKQQGWIKNCLVICPSTLKTQWAQEVEKFTYEEAIIIQSNKNRKKLYDRIREQQPFFTIINYDLLIQKERIGKEVIGKTKEGKDKTKIVFGDYLDLNELRDIGYDMVILDEAQNIINPESERAVAIRSLPTKHHLLLTGTPIAKELKNVFQLFDLIHPTVLTTTEASFEERQQLFEDLFLLTTLDAYALPGFKKVVKGGKNVEFLKKKMHPFFLRRTTEDVSDDMPEKREIVRTVGWEPQQKKLYDHIKEELDLSKEKLSGAKDDEERTKWDNHIKFMSMLLLAVCDTPELLLHSTSPVVKRLLDGKTSFPQPQKVTELLKMIEEIVLENDGKVVIFTRFERLTHILKRDITQLFDQHAKTGGGDKSALKTFLYTGNNPTGCQWRDDLAKSGDDPKKAICESACPFFQECESRTKSAWHFQNDPDTRVLIATDAGNSGVNLQSGGYLINYDLPDRFDIYDQRNARIRRLGSKHDTVYIYNLVIEGGSDESKYPKLMEQKAIIDDAVENDESKQLAIQRASTLFENLPSGKP